VHHSNIDANSVGKRIVLPSSFIGGNRQMTQLYADSMAGVREFGKPDLFITMTCNPYWPEIQAELLPHQKAEDRPDIVARIFKLKKDALIDDLVKKGIFGAAEWCVHTVEFQKRGLPHIHIILTLKPGSKITSTELYDLYVSAEIPDQDQNPSLYEKVTKHMIHGPCGVHNRNSPCMKDGECSKGFPKVYHYYYFLPNIIKIC
jgi:hypothetical protein